MAACHLKLKSPHEVATAYQEAAVCYRKTDTEAAVRCYKQTSEVRTPLCTSCLHFPASVLSESCASLSGSALSAHPRAGARSRSRRPRPRLHTRHAQIHIELGRFTSAAKVQKEIGELFEAEGDTAAALTAYEEAAEYYNAEESKSQANQVLLKVAGLAADAQNYSRAIEIYEQVAIASLESNLLRFSVKGYLLSAGVCRLASGEIGAAVNALERYEGMDASFATTREGQFLRSLVSAYEAMDEEQFTEVVREYDEVSRLDAQKTTLLLAVKKKIKDATDDIT